MTKQVSVRDEDYDLAQKLAQQLGSSVDETLGRALREFGRRSRSEYPMTPDQQMDLDSLRALVEEAQQHIKPGGQIDEGFLYDWNGLPA